ncbi:Acyltransferase LovD [Lachnellula suecica]|uniref:Acyltransferase LovD n=1 Tax=Lachnellula suecica TaxID=602035 RepID=A0A8T9C9F5_9HELO|nr:Acyltransferase LovD [Lachnellula suecica]
MATFEKAYEDAHTSGLLPGVTLLAANREGTFKYEETIGVRSLKPGDSTKPMQLDSVLAIASCTKLMTAISVLQCVERGQLDLDADVAPILPEAGKFGVITDFDDVKNEALFEPKTGPITLRQLLTHTSGHTYDFFNPSLLKWRESRGETPMGGPTIEEKSTLPLVFQPGTGWAYGGSIDWAGKMVERVTGESLETHMSKNIWTPLGIKDITFWPLQRDDMRSRIADVSGIGPDGKCVDMPWDMTVGAKECMGGGGAYATSSAYFDVLQAVLREDTKLLSPASYAELFRPQLNDQCKEALNNLILTDQAQHEYLSVNVPRSAKKNWCFAGLVLEEDQTGWMRKNTILWAGLPCIIWFIDREAGLCGFAGTQVVPPMAPPIVGLHGNFQREIYDLLASANSKSRI